MRGGGGEIRRVKVRGKGWRGVRESGVIPGCKGRSSIDTWEEREGK